VKKERKLPIINPIGLVVNIFGALLLIWGEMHSDAAFLKYRGTGEGKVWCDSEPKKLPWRKRWPLAIGRVLGSQNVMDMNQGSIFDSFPIIFWGIVLLTLGFLLQAIGSFTCQR
jgi:hypothetical protein